MRKELIHGATAALMLLFFSSASLAQEADAPKKTKPKESFASLEEKSAKAFQEENWVAWYSANMSMHKRRPYVPDYLISVIRASAQLGRKRTAYHYMLQLQRQGLSYDFNTWDETAGMRGTEAYEYINKLMIEAGQPSGNGSPVFDLNLAPGDLGDVDWDESRQRFLVGTRSEGKLLAVDDSGNAETLLEANGSNGLWAIEGLAVDEKNNDLWIASSASPVFSSFSPADANKGALFQFELDTLAFKARYGIPQDGLPHSLGGIAFTENGEVYVVDRAVPIIYSKPVQGEMLQRFGGSRELVALTDIAVTPDNSRVFVADAVMGVLAIDPRAKRMVMLEAPENVNLSGIYGIEFTGQELVVTQSGISPQRLASLKLDAAGAAVEFIVPMATALEEFDTPGVGTIRGDNMFYFSNHGTSTATQSLQFMATPLDSGAEVKTPEMRLFEQSVKEQEEKSQQ